MSTTVERWLATFESLSDSDKRSAAELLRRLVLLDSPALTDDALDEVAAATFLELDAREAADEVA